MCAVVLLCKELERQRLKRCCEEVNKDLDVEGLSNGMNKRLKKLHDSGGGRLRY